MTRSPARARRMGWYVAAALCLAAGCGRGDHSLAAADPLEIVAGTHDEPGVAAPPAPDTFAAAPPPFSPGIFPCNRCHGDYDPGADPRPTLGHTQHLARGLECLDCHEGEDDEPVIPDFEVCEECHDDPDEWSDDVGGYFTATATADGGHAFPDRWQTPNVKRVHARHAEKEIPCESCHGQPSAEPFGKPGSRVLMLRCVTCHESRSVSVECKTCHDDISERQHADIVLRHAEDQRTCLDCHSEEDRNSLRLANGTHLPFEESYRLCGQCHGPKLRDWKLGLHGKRSGSWTGGQEYLLCAHCHDPHTPAFPSMTPQPPPRRPEDVR